MAKLKEIKKNYPLIWKYLKIEIIKQRGKMSDTRILSRFPNVDMAITWSETSQGRALWSKVHRGDYSYFYNYYNN